MHQRNPLGLSGERWRGSLAAALLAVAQACWAAPTPLQSARCVAALKARAEPLAQRVRQGDAAAEAPLAPIVTASFTFIGIAYKQGIRSKQAEALLKEAEKAQAHWPAAELAKVQDACQAEGLQLYAQANFFERQIVELAVRSRIDKLRRPH